MCYVGKATKIFIFVVTVSAVLGVVLGLGIFRHGFQKSRHCSDDSCNSSPVIFLSPSPTTHVPPTAASAYNLPNSPTTPNPPEFNRSPPPPNAVQSPPETIPSPSPPIPSPPTAAAGEAPSLSPPGSAPVTPSPMHAQLRFRIRERFIGF